MSDATWAKLKRENSELRELVDRQRKLISALERSEPTSRRVYSNGQRCYQMEQSHYFNPRCEEAKLNLDNFEALLEIS